MELHRWEYRLYRAFWMIIPVSLAIMAFGIPALQPPPLVRIEVTETIPDHIFQAKEEIQLSFKSVDLDPKKVEFSWFFGDSIQVQQETMPDSFDLQLEPKVKWVQSDTQALGMDVQVSFDTLPAPSISIWAKTNQSEDSTVLVKFPHPGKYRLKLLATDPKDGKQTEHQREVEIMEGIPRSPYDDFVKIIGPTKGLVEEELVFFTTGSNAHYWYWKFGDGKNLDDNREQVVYSFDKVGTYTIELKTNASEEWLKHQVQIFPTWNADSLPEKAIDSAAVYLADMIIDIKRHLQAIADASPENTEAFYRNKEYIERRYISLDFRPMNVWVNGSEEPTDFESYCQRIHFLQGELEIDDVQFEWATDANGGKIRNLSVAQRQLTN